MQAHLDLSSLFESEFSIVEAQHLCCWLEEKIVIDFRSYKFGFESTPDHLTAPLFFQAALRQAIFLCQCLFHVYYIDY